MNVLKHFNHTNHKEFNNPTINKWMELYKTKIETQNFLGLITFYKGLSILTMKNNIFFNHKTDLRLFTIIFSDAGSGKGMTNELYYDIFTKAGAKIKVTKELDEDKLIGSPNLQIHNRNLMKGYDENHPVYINPKITGYFETYDDVVFEESHDLFENDLRIQSLLRCAADNYKSPTNLLTNDLTSHILNISYYTKCSWGTYSYHFSNLQKLGIDLVTNGIYQRSLSLFIRMDQEQLDNIINFKNYLSKEKISHLNDLTNNVVDDVKTIFDKYKNCVINMNDDEHDFLVRQVNLIKDIIIFQAKDNESKFFYSYIIRAKNNIIKIACLNALLNNNEIVDGVVYLSKNDIMAGSVIIKQCLKSVCNELQPIIKKQLYIDIIHDVRKAMKDKTKITQKELNTLMKDYWDCGISATYYRIIHIRHIFDIRRSKSKTLHYTLKPYDENGELI